MLKTHPSMAVLMFSVLNPVYVHARVCACVCIYPHAECGQKKCQYLSFGLKRRVFGFFMVFLCFEKFLTVRRGGSKAGMGRSQQSLWTVDQPFSPYMTSLSLSQCPPLPFLWLKRLPCPQLTLHTVLCHATCVTVCRITKTETTIIWKKTTFLISPRNQSPSSSQKINFITASLSQLLLEGISVVWCDDVFCIGIKE